MAPREIERNAEPENFPCNHTCADAENPSAPIVAPAADSPPLLSVAFRDYLDRKIDVRRELKAARRPEFMSTLSTVVWILGDKPVDLYTDADMSRFEKTFLTLPRDYKNFRAKPEQTPAEVLEIAAALRAELPKIKDPAKRKIMEDQLRTTTPETFNKHLSQFKSFLVGSKLPDITKGYHIAVDKSKRARRSKRQAPVVEHVEKLFQSPYWTGQSRTSASCARGPSSFATPCTGRRCCARITAPASRKPCNCGVNISPCSRTCSASTSPATQASA